MRKLLLMAGAGALLALGAPAAADAKPGKGKGHAAHLVKVKPAKAKVVGLKPAKVKVAKVKPAKVKAKWLTPCPPGLIWHGDVCMPRPHAAWIPEVNTRVPLGWAYTPWNRIPSDLRSRYVLDRDYRYIHRDGVVYVVDPRTRLITSILNAVL